MDIILELLKTYGIYLDDSASTLIKLALYYLILTIMLLIKIVNICIYLLYIYVLSQKKKY